MFCDFCIHQNIEQKLFKCIRITKNKYILFSTKCLGKQSVLQYSLVSVFANARRLVVLRTVIVRAIVEGPVSFSNRSASPLIIKMPMKTRKRPVLCTFMLEKRWTLLHSEFFQISVMQQLQFNVHRHHITFTSNFVN